MLRTSLPAGALPDDDVVGRYKDLADVERFFRTLNAELDMRPIRHRLAHRVRAHMFLRMLSYYISWHIKQALAPILFVDNDKPAAAKRPNPVAPAQRSDEALTEAARKRTEDDDPVHSFTSLLADPATICANHIQLTDDTPAFTKITTPTPLQRRAFELLGVSPATATRRQHTTTKPQLNTTIRPTPGELRARQQVRRPIRLAGRPACVSCRHWCGFNGRKAMHLRHVRFAIATPVIVGGLTIESAGPALGADPVLDGTYRLDFDGPHRTINGTLNPTADTSATYSFTPSCTGEGCVVNGVLMSSTNREAVSAHNPNVTLQFIDCAWQLSLP